MKSDDQIIQSYVPTKVTNLRVTFPKEHSNVPLGVLYLSENCNLRFFTFLSFVIHNSLVPITTMNRIIDG